MGRKKYDATVVPADTRVVVPKFTVVMPDDCMASVEIAERKVILAERDIGAGMVEHHLKELPALCVAMTAEELVEEFPILDAAGNETNKTSTGEKMLAVVRSYSRKCQLKRDTAQQQGTPT